MKLSVRLAVSERNRTVTFTEEDLGVESKSEWDELSEEEKQSRLIEATDFIEQPWWQIDSVTEKD